MSTEANPKQSTTNLQPLDMEKWQAIMADWEAGNESQKQYCARLGLSFNTFAHARSKLLQKKPTPSPKPTFVPVTVSQPKHLPVSSAAIMTLENPQGFKLHMPSNVSLDRLAALCQLCGW